MAFQHVLCTAGPYAAFQAHNSAELARTQRFRATCFGTASGRDADPLDDICDHIVILDTRTGDPVGYFRILVVPKGRISSSYSARFYDLSGLDAHPGVTLEIGRFCTAAPRRDPTIVRIAWSVVTDYVDRWHVSVLFGCSSFSGTDTRLYTDAFAWLYEYARAPKVWAPKRRASEVAEFAHNATDVTDQRRAMQQMPPLLRSYLMLGGWVSDHAVIDRDLQTMHVFTGVETARIPPARQKLLRALRHQMDVSGTAPQKVIDGGLAAS